MIELPGRTKDLVLTVIILTSSYAFYAFALDAPHTNTPGYGIQCGNCHWINSAATPPWTTIAFSPAPADDTINNRRCWACHTGGKAPTVATHSSSSTSSVRWSPEGWTTECVICHNPHQQRQTRAWGAASYLVTGGGPVTVGGYASGTNTTEITLSGALTGNYFGYYLLPDRNYPFYYRIESDTTNKNKIQVKGEVNSAYVTNGGYAIVYGKNVNELISYRNPGNVTVGGQVKLFSPSGANGPGDSDKPTSVCLVCHTKESHWSAGGDTDHNNRGECKDCHSHPLGFKATCGECHGGPPIVDAPVAPNGLAWTNVTGSLTAGAHNAHVNVKGIVCSACHYNSVASGPTHNTGKITMGFYNLGGTTQGGSYDGQVSANYDWTTTGPATMVTNSGTKTCSNVYCHGASMAPNGGSDTTPVWSDPSTAVCGTCHGATAANPPTRGSHGKHVTAYLNGYNYQCGLCHKDPSTDGSLHVNNKSEVIFSADPKTTGGSYGGTQTMLDAYGTCMNVYCHSSVQSSPPGGSPIYRTTPAWGTNNSLGCGGCHMYAGGSYPPITGSHSKHFEYNWGYGAECSPCHNWNQANFDDYNCAAPCHANGGTGPARRDLHANGAINVLFPPMYGGAYDGSSNPGAPYGSCSNTYCHGNFAGSGLNATPTWNDAASAACGTCHAWTSGRSRGDSHYVHVDRMGYVCDLCHYDTTSGSALKSSYYHVNGAADWHFNPADPRTAAGLYSDTRPASTTWSAQGSRTPPRSIAGTAQADGNCSNITCHSSVQGENDPTGPPVYYGNYFNTAKWGSYLDCSGCHKAGNHGGSDRISSGSHSKHLATFGYSITSNFGTCQVCHYISDGSGNPCRPCHDSDGYRRRYVNHGDNMIEVNFLTSFVGAEAYYSGDPAPRTPYGSCSNVYCHSTGKLTVPSGNLPAAYNGSAYAVAEWGSGTLGCNGCHGRTTSNGMPDYVSGGAGTDTSNSHEAHISGTGFGCQECHFRTTKDGTSLNMDDEYYYNGMPGASGAADGYDFHINGNNKDIYFKSSGSYDGAGKICSATYCHSDGTSVSTGTIPSNSSPSWGGVTTCSSCHGFPPLYVEGKNNSHDKHVVQLGYTCNTCHLSTTSTGNKITDRTKHANGTYDVQPDPNIIVGGSPVSFIYTFDPGMSRCDNVSCHGGSGNYWASTTLSSHITYSFGGWCYEVNFEGYALGGIPPYTFEWNFGDGQTAAGSAATHRYAGPGPYNVTLQTSDTNSQIAAAQTSVTPQLTNQPAVAGYTVSVSGMTVTLTDLSYDPDYNQCGHSGQGLISILWGDGTNTTTNIDFIDMPSNQIFLHTYTAPGTYYLYHSVKDNACIVNWCQWSCIDCLTGRVITVPQ
ncbi:MAG: CxxxxCH/CxxCH domain-containing protein [Nitrospiraceae bacterium]|nr:CxxxxCH/CxxCH domain-containing protein [Nitrospiraceae bacterium]